MLERFVEEAARVRPDIELVLPWRRTEDPDVLAEALRKGRVRGVEIRTRVDDIPFEPGDWRTIVMGSGLRRIANDLGGKLPDVLAACERWARERSVTTVRVSSMYAVAEKQGGDS
jgi:hypothetical protein